MELSAHSEAVLCNSGCEVTSRNVRSFVRRQPPIRPALNAPLLLLQQGIWPYSVFAAGTYYVYNTAKIRKIQP